MAGRIIRIVTIALCVVVWAGFPLVAEVEAQSGSGGSTDTELMQLNVKDVSVQEVLKLIAEAGKFNIAIGSGVKGRVTLYIDDITPRDLLEIVVSVVDAAYVEEDGAVWVMEKSAYESRYGESFADNLKTRTFILKEADVKDVMPTLKDLLGKKTDIKADVSRNLIRIKASPRLLREAKQLIAMIDNTKVSTSFQLKNVSLEVASGYIEKLLKGRANFVEDPGNQRIVVSANQLDLDRISDILEMLDSGEGIESAMLDVKYAEPDSLAEQLRPHLTLDIGQIYADKIARKLVVVDYPMVVAKISDLAQEYDTPLRQVLLEAKIIQISTNREVRTGIDWGYVQRNVNVFGNFPALGETEPGIRSQAGDLMSKDFQVIAEALETYGDTELLSSPRLVVIDGGLGHIHVGSQVPYKTITTRETPAGTVSQFEEVIVVDVGVKLEVEVRILGDDMVFLKVHPEVSSVTGERDGIPIVDASTIDSSLMVKDGNTVILGGLMRDETRTVRKGIPILSRIPLLKYFFSSNQSEKIKTELIILLTPTVMSGRETYQPTEISEQ
ncbi:MAG: hypothetical protein KOO60_03270 [Gemmatimonadales bacterium]|nr:hypothetical protein [Gemmatimonadales bacterium]